MSNILCIFAIKHTVETSGHMVRTVWCCSTGHHTVVVCKTTKKENFTLVAISNFSHQWTIDQKSIIKIFDRLCINKFHENLAPCILNTLGKQNYFTGYGILLHEFPVVAGLFTQSNNNEGKMRNSIATWERTLPPHTYSSSCVGITKFDCREVWN